MNIKEEYVYFGLESIPREDAIILAGEKLVEHGFAQEPYIQSMLDKEKTDQTYIGNGIAIPHGLNESKKFVKKSGIVILHFPQGIEYGDNKVYILIGIAGSNSDHLGILQDIAIKLSDQDIVNNLITAKEKSVFVELFNNN